MTQKQLVLKYVEEFGSILPAKMAGKLYLGHMFGSETSRACRALRAEGKLTSHDQGKFEVFQLGNDSLIKKIADDFLKEFPSKTQVEKANQLF